MSYNVNEVKNNGKINNGFVSTDDTTGKFILKENIFENIDLNENQEKLPDKTK